MHFKFNTVFTFYIQNTLILRYILFPRYDVCGGTLQSSKSVFLIHVTFDQFADVFPGDGVLSGGPYVG